MPSSSMSILHAGLLDDAADDLAAGADDVADLVGPDLQRDDARRVRGDVARAAVSIVPVHHLEDVQAAVARLVQRLAHDLAW